VILRSSLRRTLCGWLAAVLLFTQWVTAAYACPQLQAAGPAEAAAVMPCHETPGRMDPDQPLLCKAHCTADASTRDGGVTPLNVPTAPSWIDAPWQRTLDLAGVAQLAASMPEAQPVGPPDGAPPLYLSLLVLRN
jgi:hypothetical protein